MSILQVIDNKNIIDKYAIIIPAGSGKTTIAKKYECLYDIDDFKEERDNILLQTLSILSMKSGNWDEYNKKEYDIIKDKINLLPHNSIILIHCIKKALQHNLKILCSLKITKDLMLEIAEQRGKKYNNWRKQITIYSWEHTNAIVCKSFDEIEKIIVTKILSISK